ncbi:MAG: hypothetical protein FWC39_11560 [Bacteroidetes bacterium]|nr:hypothetical protein [Bacteroidota bacterium]
MNNDSKISIEDYRAMVAKAENSGYMSYNEHLRKFNDWFNEISKTLKHCKGEKYFAPTQKHITK